MNPINFVRSKIVYNEGYSYVAIAEPLDKLHPNWAPEREISFALNTLLKSLFEDTLGECQEGIFESTLPPDELEAKLKDFVYSPILDPIIYEFFEDLQG